MRFSWICFPYSLIFVDPLAASCSVLGSSSRTAEWPSLSGAERVPETGQPTETGTLALVETNNDRCRLLRHHRFARLFHTSCCTSSVGSNLKTSLPLNTN